MTETIEKHRRELHDLERQVMNSYNPEDNQGALERLGIPVQTTPPEQILIAGKAKSIRFRVSRPHGYSYGDVESYQFDYVIPTLEWYAETLHQRDLAIHKLGELIDKLEVDLLNTKAQLDNKDYNEAIGLAVETSEQDEEMEALLIRVETLQKQLNQANAALEEAQTAPISSPDEEESYSRAEVEGFLASAVEDADKAKDAYYAEILVQKNNELAIAVEQAREEGRQEAPQEESNGYTEEEVRNAIETAVHQAVSEAVAKAEKEKEFQYSSLLEAQAKALDEAEARATEAENRATEAEARATEAENRASSAENTTPAGYSQEEVEQAIANALAAQEADILSRIPEANSIDQISELTNEGDLVKLRAENKTLKKSVEALSEYSNQLDAYIASLEGKTVEAPAPANAVSNGRPLPKLRPEDL
jgi:hypothetical protein